MVFARIAALVVVFGACLVAQVPNDPFPQPIDSTDVIKVNFVEFASLPDVGGQSRRGRCCWSTSPARAACSSTTCAGRSTASATTARRVTPYVDINAPHWDVSVQSQRQRARLPELRVPSAVQPAGHAAASASSTPSPTPPTRRRRPTSRAGGGNAHARHGAARVDGEEPGRRDLRRRRAARADALRAAVRQSQRRPARVQSARRAGQRRLRPALHRLRRRRQRRRSARTRAEPGVGLRQDPAHRSARHQQRQRQVRHPGEQPVRQRRQPDTLGEIYAYGVRNPQRFAWDPKNGNLFVADIGQNIVEEISPSPPAPTSAGTTGRAASATSAAGGRASTTRAATRR